MKKNGSLLAMGLLAIATCLSATRVVAQYVQVYLTDVPDYSWHRGCFGTASGNLAGFWDRHGYTNIYTGLVDGGVAPLRDEGKLGIRSLWASRRGFDGKPATEYGHDDDYWVDYQFTGQDPYVTAGRPEHAPDCIADFIGLSQKKWANLAGECGGNIDAYSFVFWDKTGNRRVNYSTTNAGTYIPDIGSGLKDWMRWRGYDADVFTQLADFNPERTTAAGFTYEDVKREINAGFPVLCFLQPQGVYRRTLSGVTNVNPEIHGVMIYGYFSDANFGDEGVLIRTSWGTGEAPVSWSSSDWVGTFPVRGVIGFRPKPRITSMNRRPGNLTLTWDGPTTFLSVYDGTATTNSGPLQRYVVQRSATLSNPDWKNITPPSTEKTVTFAEPTGTTFYRVSILP